MMPAPVGAGVGLAAGVGVGAFGVGVGLGVGVGVEPGVVGGPGLCDGPVATALGLEAAPHAGRMAATARSSRARRAGLIGAYPSAIVAFRPPRHEEGGSNAMG